MQDLAGVEQAVAHLAEHQAEGVLQADDRPELAVVLLLALLRQRVLVRRLLRVDRLRQLLRREQQATSNGAYCA